MYAYSAVFLETCSVPLARKQSRVNPPCHTHLKSNQNMQPNALVSPETYCLAAVFCNVGSCVALDGTCVPTDGSVCAPTSTVVNQPCPSSTTYCSLLTNNNLEAQINSVCTGFGQCNATTGTTGNCGSLCMPSCCLNGTFNICATAGMHHSPLEPP